MKKLAVIVAGVAVIGAVGWGVVWYLGKGRVEQQIATEVEGITARGWTVVWSEHAIGGFPLGYEVTLKDLAATQASSGVLVRFPEVVVTARALEAGRVEALLPETFTVTIPIPESMRGEAENAPRVIELQGGAKALRLASAQAGEEVRAVEATADGLSLSLDGGGAGRSARLVLEGFATTGEIRPEKSQHAIAARDLGFEMSEPGEGGALNTVTVRSGGVSARIDTDLATLPGLAAMVYQGERGRFDLSYELGQTRAELAMKNTPGVPNGALAVAIASGTGVVQGRAGSIDMSIEAHDKRWTLTPEDPAVPYRGEIAAELAQFRYLVPMAPTPDMQPGQLRLALENLTADDAFWGLVDPGAKLDHGPAKLVVDIEAMLRVNERLDLLPPGAAPPFSVSNLMVNEASVAALGATARATGDVEMRHANAVPYGTLDVEMTGLQALIDALTEAGLLTGERREMADAMLQVYTVPAEGEDSWTSDVIFADGVTSVNGIPVE